MGAVQGKEDTINTNRTMVPPPPSTVQALQAMLSPSPPTDHTLDRTLKGFLRHCNLSGLEYRLRLAGIYTLEDLVNTDEVKLTRHGFTRLMARRLYTSLDEYLTEPDESPPSISLRHRPSERVRRIQQPFTRASTLMRSRQNYGKMNLKRIPSNKRPSTPQRPLSLRMPDDNTKRGRNSEEGSYVVSAYFPEGLINTADSGEVYNDATPLAANSELTLGNTQEEIQDTLTSDQEIETPVNQQVDTPINERTDLTPVNQEVYIPVNQETNLTLVNQGNETSVNDVQSDIDDFVLISDSNINEIDSHGSDTTPIATPTPGLQFLLQEAPLQIERCLSVPNGLHRLQLQEPPIKNSLTHKLCSSSPCLFDLYTEEDPVSSDSGDVILEAISILQDTFSKLDDIVTAMCVLLEMIKEGYWALTNTEDIEWIVKSVNNYVEDLELAELGCRVLKYATYQLVGNNDLLMDGQLSLLSCECVVNTLKSHPHSQRVQLNGSLVLANLLRIDKSLGVSLMEVKIYSLFTTTLQLYGWNELVLLAMMNALASIASGLSVEENHVITSELEGVIKEVMSIMESCKMNGQLQNYSLSFLTLSLIDVAAQLDSKIARELVQVIVQSMTNHVTDIELVVWGCKVLSQIASHEILQEEPITESVTDIILSVLAEHPKSSKIQMWASYALYQQVTYNKTLLPLVQDTGIIQKCQESLPHLTTEAQSYLQNLSVLATL